MSRIPVSRRYLQYGNVKEQLTSERKNADDVEIVVYSIGGIMRQTIPNPNNKSASEGVRQTYDSGFFTQRDKMFCAKAAFDDEKNWSG